MKTLLILSLSSFFVFSAANLDHEIDNELSQVSPIYTGDQALKTMASLLQKNFDITESEINRINISNRHRISKMHEYDKIIAKYHALVLGESMKQEPSTQKLNRIYQRIKETREKKMQMWLAMKESIWDIMDVRTRNKKVRNRRMNRDQEPMGALRW